MKYKLTNTSATIPLAVGKFEIAPASYIIVDEWDWNYAEHWDQVNDTLVGTALLVESYSDILEEGEGDSGLLVRAGEAITRGNLLYISSWNATDQCPVVMKADADDLIKLAVLFAPEVISSGATGQGLRTGKLVGTATKTVDTNAATLGDKVYLSGTPGAYVLTTTPGNTNSQEVGVVSKKSATLGEIWFDLTVSKLQNLYAAISGLTASYTELNSLAGVTAGTAAASKAVVLDTNSYNDGVVCTFRVSHLVAAVTAGTTTAVPAVSGKRFQVLSIAMRAAGGSLSGPTTVEVIEETANTVFLSHITADLTSGVWHNLVTGTPVITGMTAGGMTSAANKKLLVTDTGGSASATATSIDTIVVGYYTTA